MSIRKINRFIEFKSNSLNILKATLKASSPEEGCALLIGSEKIPAPEIAECLWEVLLIWPCCNIWKPGIFSLDEHLNNQSIEGINTPSKLNRFAIDPREQLLAQKWAREQKLNVLGTAHSHPSGDAKPSEIDRRLNFVSGLMAIVDKFDIAKVWWVANDKHFYPIEVRKAK